MSKKAGLLNMRILRNDAFLARECKQMMDRLYADTLRLMEDNKKTLENIAQTLLREETLDEERLNRLVSNL
jgi:cell division protease FtsH